MGFQFPDTRLGGLASGLGRSQGLCEFRRAGQIPLLRTVVKPQPRFSQHSDNPKASLYPYITPSGSVVIATGR